MIQILALYHDFESAKTIHYLYVLIWGCGGCWRFLTGFGIFILNWIQSLEIYILMIQILALYHDFEGAKNIHVL